MVFSKDILTRKASRIAAIIFKSLLGYCRIAAIIFKSILRYSGLEFIYRKFIPHKNSQKLPTGIVWLFGIYITAFGIAFQRYESTTNRLNVVVSNTIAQLYTDRSRYALSRIPHLQWQPCPYKPELFNPGSIYRSLFGEKVQYKEQVDYLKDIIIDHRNTLLGLNLEYIDLRGTLFTGGNFENTFLLYAKLNQAQFVGVNFFKCKFFNAKFNYSWFHKCTHGFINAILKMLI